MNAGACVKDISVMDQKNNYSIRTEGNTLIFRTTAFIAEKSSVLHSGVYSREFTSVLFASGICMAFYILLSSYMSGLLLYAVLVLTLAAAFILSRSFIFKEKYLKAAFDRDTGKACLFVSGLLTKKREEISLDDIVSVETGSRRFEPENRDGADFVQKISVQHGSAVPGLGEAEEFVTVSLRLRDGSERTIYAAGLGMEPELPVREIREFLSK